MATGNADYGHEYREPDRDGMPGWLKGCLIALLIFAVVVGLLIWWIMASWKNWAVSLGSQVVQQTIDSSDLPEAEKAEVRAELKRLEEAAKAGKIGEKQLTILVEELGTSPLMSSIMIFAVESQYFAKSGLSDEEKEAGRVALRRFMFGVTDETIPQAKVQELIGMISTEKADGQQQLKQTLTDDELKAFLDAAKTAADEAEIPEDVPEVDPSDEIKRIVDAALAGTEE